MLNSIIFNYLKNINHKYTFKTIIFIHFVKQSIIILLSFLILSTYKVSAKEIIIDTILLDIDANRVLVSNFPLKKPSKPFLLSPIKKPIAPLSSKTLSNKEFDVLSLAIEQSKKWKWDRVSDIKKNLKDETAINLIEWIRYYNGASDLTFADYIEYLNTNDNWPEIEKIKYKAETKIRFSDSPAKIIDFFENNEIQTGIGKIYLGNAFVVTGRKEDGIKLIREGYIEGSFGRADQKQIIIKYKSFLDIEHHKKRITNLLWNKQYRTAQRLIKYVDKDHQKLYEARIGLISFAGGVDQLISNVPTKLKNNVGLVHDRINWRIKKRKFSSALDLLQTINKNNSSELERPDKFWKLKSYSIRKLIDEHRYDEAYRLSINHGLKTSADIAAAEWLAGWLSFSFLNDPATASLHFKNIYDISSRPISKARGSFWLARAYQNLGKDGLAQEWFIESSKYNLTFYGQLAHQYLKEKKLFAINKYSESIDIDNPKPGMIEIYKSLYLLNELEEFKIMKKFIWSIAKSEDTSERLRITKLAKKFNRNDFAVQAGKFIYYDTLLLAPESFPSVNRPEFGKIIFPPQPFIHSVIRQESQFDPKAGSYAGAKGLMQLMPYTAKKLSSGLNLKYSKSRLTNDPVYNVILGSAYLDQLLSMYDGSYILSLAAYNAGSSRVKRWIARYGDPRTNDIDPVDWIELIPFKETRNYVQRVMENLQVYEFIQNDYTQNNITLPNNLIRGKKNRNKIVEPILKP